MKRQPRKKSDRAEIVLRLWTHPEAQQALPYLRSVVHSLREHWLSLCLAKRQDKLWEQRFGRPDRTALLQHQDILQEIDRAADQFEDALHELAAMDVFCLDPSAGLALIPFRQGDDLAWFVFDLFDEEGLRSWRFHHDPLESRRPLAEASTVSAMPENEVESIGDIRTAQQ